MDKPERVMATNILGSAKAATSETEQFIRQTSVPVDRGCFNYKETYKKSAQVQGGGGRQPRSLPHKVLRFIKADYKTVVLGAAGSLSIAIGIVLIFRTYFPLRSYSQIENGGLLPGNQNISTRTPQSRWNPAENIHLNSQHPAAPKEDPAVVTVYSVQELKSLPSTVTSIVIKSLGKSRKGRSLIIESKPNIHTLEIDASDITRGMLVQILNKFTEVQTLSLNVDQLCKAGDPDSDTVPDPLDNLRHFRIVHAHNCSSELQWILSWDVHYLRRLVLCQVDFSKSTEFKALHAFINGTSSEVEEIVLQDAYMCPECNFYDLRIDNLRETVEDIKLDKENEKRNETVVCMY